MTIPEFSISVSGTGPRRTLVLGGELDLVTAAELEATAASVCDEGIGELVLDLRGLSFVDSSGVRSILACWDRARGRCGFLLIPGPPAVQRTFEVTGLIDRLPFDGSGP
jgi:anti-sigma B factor antagonist